MVPISKQESIEFFKNLYSDLNVMTICDADDNRNECDLRLTGNYQYNTLPQKVKEMFSVACNNLRCYKICDIPEPDNWAEDYWFGRELEKCVKSKNPGKLEGTLHVINDMSKILHKEYTDIGVSLKLGRNVQQ
ncbi:hypothetical protein BB558_002931 [Smittium angustum]|uniref:Uncharacterized protein n=1 Tax=Smittium angustum TaxID=133377 RepID=A0A2U1J7E0_SMIAN|nr:hypothetical protein BB558_002931 [Smittium angustum]